MNDEEIRKKLATRGQYSGRVNALQAWERTAPPLEVKVFGALVRNWLLMIADGHRIGWKAFNELCTEELRTFSMGDQALKGALSERIKRL